MYAIEAAAKRRTEPNTIVAPVIHVYKFPLSRRRRSFRAIHLSVQFKGKYHGRSMGDIMIFGQNSLNLNFIHCVN